MGSSQQVEPQPLACVLGVYHSTHVMMHDAGVHDAHVTDEVCVAYRDLNM